MTTTQAALLSLYSSLILMVSIAVSILLLAIPIIITRAKSMAGTFLYILAQVALAGAIYYYLKSAKPDLTSLLENLRDYSFEAVVKILSSSWILYVTANLICLLVVVNGRFESKSVND